MKINIEKNKAISLLNKRIQELNNFDYEPMAWRSKVQSDVNTIFGPGQKVMDIISLTLDSPYDLIKEEYRRRGKQTARKMLEGFIESINDHIPDPLPLNQALEISKKDAEFTAMKNEVIRQHAEISSLNNALQNSINVNQNLLIQIEQDKLKIIKLQSSIWQIDGVNISRLWEIFKSLPLQQQFAVVGFFVVLFMGGFATGVFFQKNHWLG